VYTDTLKKSLVEPSISVPYLISLCMPRSSALLMGESILFTVRKAARLAVYDETITSVNAYQALATNLLEPALGAMSEPIVGGTNA